MPSNEKNEDRKISVGKTGVRNITTEVVDRKNPIHPTPRK